MTVIIFARVASVKRPPRNTFRVLALERVEAL